MRRRRKRQTIFVLIINMHVHTVVMVYAVHPFERHEGVAQLFTMFFLAVGGAIIMWSCLVVVATTTYCPCEPTLTSFVFPNVLQCFQQHNY